MKINKQEVLSRFYSNPRFFVIDRFVSQFTMLGTISGFKSTGTQNSQWDRIGLDGTYLREERSPNRHRWLCLFAQNPLDGAPLLAADVVEPSAMERQYLAISRNLGTLRRSTLVPSLRVITRSPHSPMNLGTI